jgi:hypothetical protein
MRWETPSFVEINMDAEIGGYQDDLGDPPDVNAVQQDVIAAELPGDEKMTQGS